MNDPLAQLERSHRRLEEACDALLSAVAARDLATIADVSAFFGRQVRRHEQDEEASLFPRLTLAEVGPLLARLAAAHHEHERLHAQLEDAVAGRTEGSDPWVELGAIATALAAAYRAHIREEETELFPVARRVLTESALAEMRVEMDGRRGR